MDKLEFIEYSANRYGVDFSTAETLLDMLCAGHGKEVEDESSLQADLKRSASLDKVILVRE